MKFEASVFLFAFATLNMVGRIPFAGAQERENNMVKMCFFYGSPSGHARSDPIINQQCPSAHIHTFYGPQNFHPDTVYEELRDADPTFSSSPVLENQSLYWHPTIYRVTGNGATKTYTRVESLVTGPYYRWDTSTPEPTKAFPPGFRLITFSDEPRADLAGENESNLFTECCSVSGGSEQCDTRNGLWFPTKSCDFLGIAFAMPTCWDGVSLGNEPSGIGSDHKSHVQYTLDGKVNGPCPDGFQTKVPQIQLFIRINNYQGGTYVLSDGGEKTGVFHFDFFNGWQEQSLQRIIDNCPVIDGPYEADEYNPPCNCDDFLTESRNPGGEVCDSEVKRLILNEETRVIQGEELPTGTCQGPTLEKKTWARNENPPITCSISPPSSNEPDDAEGEEDEDNDGADNPEGDDGDDSDMGPDDVEGDDEDEPEEPNEDPTDTDEDEPEEEEPEDVDGGGSSCLDRCVEDFEVCEENLETVCGDEVFLSACKAECEDIFGDDEELESCIEDWCGEDQDFCFENESQRCRRRRRRCFRNC